MANGGQRVRITCDGIDFSRARVTIIQPDGSEITFEGVELQVVGTTTNPVYAPA